MNQLEEMAKRQAAAVEMLTLLDRPEDVTEEETQERFQAIEMILRENPMMEYTLLGFLNGALNEIDKLNGDEERTRRHQLGVAAIAISAGLTNGELN